MDRFARLSFIALSLTILFTSLRHVYRFGAAALLFNLVIVALALLLQWFRTTRSPIAAGLYALVGAWVVTGFGVVDALWDGVLKLYVRFFFPGVTLFRRTPPQPFGFEAAAILTAAASLFALYYGMRFLRARPLLWIAPLLVIVGGSAYGISTRTAPRDGGVIRIGVVVPTHGPQSPLGRAFVRAVELARDDRPARRRYELVIADSGTTPAEAREIGRAHV